MTKVKIALEGRGEVHKKRRFVISLKRNTVENIFTDLDLSDRTAVG